MRKSRKDGKNSTVDNAVKAKEKKRVKRLLRRSNYTQM
jgi:hypothetical protein